MNAIVPWVILPQKSKVFDTSGLSRKSACEDWLGQVHSMFRHMRRPQHGAFDVAAPVLLSVIAKLGGNMDRGTSDARNGTERERNCEAIPTSGTPRIRKCKSDRHNGKSRS
jgi:hypothetical protein